MWGSNSLKLLILDQKPRINERCLLQLCESTTKNWTRLAFQIGPGQVDAGVLFDNHWGIRIVNVLNEKIDLTIYQQLQKYQLRNFCRPQFQHRW